MKLITKSENSNKFKNKENVLWITILILILIFSIFKTKLILYVLPMFGFVAMAVANGINGYQKKTLKIINNIKNNDICRRYFCMGKCFYGDNYGGFIYSFFVELLCIGNMPK